MIEKIKNNKLAMQIIKFVIVGGMATAIDFVIFHILANILHINEMISNTTSFTISLIYNYIASVKWVFDVDKSKDSKKQMVIFVVCSLIGLLINNIILKVCIDFLHVFNLIGKVLATGVVMVFNFITRKLFLE